MFAFTSLNAHSSRSHAIVMLTIAKRPVGSGASGVGGGNAVQQDASNVKVGKLFLVDLAGSERLKKSRSTGAAPSQGATPALCLYYSLYSTLQSPLSVHPIWHRQHRWSLHRFCYAWYQVLKPGT